MEIEFQNYVQAQFSGLFNMITEARMVMDTYGIDEEDYKFIINNYEELKKKYPKEYEQGKQLGLEEREFIWD